MSHPFRQLNNQVIQLAAHGAIATTYPKAKQVKKLTQRLIADQKTIKLIFNKKKVSQLANLSSSDKVRIFRTGFRKGDHAAMARVVLEKTTTGKEK